MPRNTAVAVQNNFTKGLITQATALTFPENACTDTDNCIFDKIGSVYRRPSFDFETDALGYAISFAGQVVSSYLWKNVAGDGDLSIMVTQIGNYLHFYIVDSAQSLSARKHATTINLVTHAPSGVTSVLDSECQFSVGNGILFVTHPHVTTFYVEYDIDTNAFTSTAVDIEIRDLEGDLDDLLAADTRPVTLAPDHHYNLLNQGWLEAYINLFQSSVGAYPSNADVAWYYKNISDVIDYTTVTSKFVGNSPAPKGHYIYDIYDIDRSLYAAVSSATLVTIDRVSTSTFFAGRLFYSGLNFPEQNGKIWFSQIIESKDQYGRCYSLNDQTSEQLFNLLPSDGGVIRIQEAGNIVKMVSVLNSLVVFATNGIWAITGSQGTGFAANDYSINRISSNPNSSATSFVDVEGTPYWWTADGIWTVTLDKQTNALKVVSLSFTTIADFYDAIPQDCKQVARGVYDPISKIIQWIYNDVSTDIIEDKYTFNKLLNFNTLTQAFYPWSVDTNHVKIKSVASIFGLGQMFTVFDVIDTPSYTVVDGGIQVVSTVPVPASIDFKSKYLVSYVNGDTPSATFSECVNDTYLDWMSFDNVGQNYESYFVTGYTIKGQGMMKFQDNYVNVFIKNLSNSSFKIRALWNFAISGVTGKWSSEQIFFTRMNNFTYMPKRIKLRGSGYACQIKIESNEQYPFDIAGWSVLQSANKSP